MTLKAWNALIKMERDQKHSLLQQRVKIQRDLIGKTNQLLEDFRTKAEEERLEVCCMYLCMMVILTVVLVS